MGLDAIISNNQPTLATSSQQQGILGKDDFLKLLLTQMQQQDPLNPMDNEAMVAQMAQFSSLEQMSNLNDNLTSSNAISSFMEATSLLGKEVELSNPNASEDGQAFIVREVSSVQFTSSGPILSMNDGSTAQVEEILRIREKPQQVQN